MTIFLVKIFSHTYGNELSGYDSHSCSLSLDLHEMSLNIDMKTIRPVNFSGSRIIFKQELLDFVAEL